MCKPLTITADKQCEHCGKTFSRRPRFPIARWNAQRACSFHCAAQLRRTLKPRACPCCRTEFQPTHHRDKFCGKRCAAKSHKGKVAAKGMHEKYVRVYVDGVRVMEHRAVMERIIGRKLVKGENVHHKNGKTKDNRPDNLELWWRGQPAGQRVSDLISYLATYHRQALLSSLCGGQGSPIEQPATAGG